MGRGGGLLRPSSSLDLQKANRDQESHVERKAQVSPTETQQQTSLATTQGQDLTEIPWWCPGDPAT